MSAVDDDDKWISAGDASARVGDGWSSRGEIIAYAAAPGLLPSRAAHALTQRHGRRSTGAETSRENFSLPPGFWIQDDGEHERADWSSGRFTGHCGELSIRAFGVQFSRAEFDKWFPSTTKQAAAPIRAVEASPQAAKRGRTPKQEWALFWMAVIQIAHERRLNKGHFPSQKELRDEILIMMPDGALSEGSIEDPVRTVWQRFVDPSGG